MSQPSTLPPETAANHFVASSCQGQKEPKAIPQRLGCCRFPSKKSNILLVKRTYEGKSNMLKSKDPT